jgi:hypothetical protein
MYSKCKLCRKDALGREPLNGDRLGADEYKGVSKTGQAVYQGAGIYSNLMNPFQQLYKFIPGVSKITAGMNPLALALAPMTGGLTLIPGISNIFGNMFSKATHMGDCMKWWSDSNIRGMAAGVEPYAFDFHDYMMHEFPQFLRQYQVMQAGGEWAKVGIDSLIGGVSRRGRISNIFLRLVRSNPDLMTLQCAVRERAETGFTQFNQAQVDEIWAAARESARQEEYVNMVKEVDARLEPYKVKERWAQIVQSRSQNLVVKKEEGGQLFAPKDVIGVRRGTFTQVLKTGQTSSKPVTFAK